MDEMVLKWGFRVFSFSSFDLLIQLIKDPTFALVIATLNLFAFPKRPILASKTPPPHSSPTFWAKATLLTTVEMKIILCSWPLRKCRKNAFKIPINEVHEWQNKHKTIEEFH